MNHLAHPAAPARRRRLGALLALALFAALFATLGSSSPASADGEEFRILALGDSLTDGREIDSLNGADPATNRGCGYRHEFQKIANADSDIDFGPDQTVTMVGPRKGARNAAGTGNKFQPDCGIEDFKQELEALGHAGYSGWRVDELINGNDGTPNAQKVPTPSLNEGRMLQDWLVKNDPNVTILLAGWNDLVTQGGDQSAQTRNDLSQAIDILQAYDSSMKILLVGLPPVGPGGSGFAGERANFVALLPQLAADKSTGTSPVVFVDGAAGFGDSTAEINANMADAVHPNYAGNQILAQNIYDTMKSAGFLGGPVPTPTVSGVNPATGTRGANDLVLTVNGSGFTAGATADLGPGIDVKSSTFKTPTQLEVVVDVEYTAEVAARTVRVTNPGGSPGSLASGFFINGADPLPPVLRVMVLGDNMATADASVASTSPSFRGPFYDQIVNPSKPSRPGNARIDFVGSQQGIEGDANPVGLPDLDHESHAGDTTENLLAKLPAALAQDDPHVLVIYAGAIDAIAYVGAAPDPAPFFPADPPNTPAKRARDISLRINEMVKTFLAAQPDGHVIILSPQLTTLAGSFGTNVNAILQLLPAEINDNVILGRPDSQVRWGDLQLPAFYDTANNASDRLTPRHPAGTGQVADVAELAGFDGSTNFFAAPDESVPAAPANQAPSATGANVTVPLGAVADDGGSKVLEYRVTARNAGAAAAALGDDVIEVKTAPVGTPSISFTLTNGSYEFDVQARNLQGWGQKRTVSITLQDAVNQAPTVSAGPDRQITLPTNQVTLAGSRSDDGLPSGTLTSTWTKVSGLGTVTFGNANAPSTTATFSGVGTYVLRLTASDGALSSSDEVVVRVFDVGGPQSGYWVVEQDGDVYNFGPDAEDLGDVKADLAGAQAVAMAAHPDGDGYWVLASSGKVINKGSAGPMGSVNLDAVSNPARKAGEVVASIAPNAAGDGVWVFTNKGRILALGNATPAGSMASGDVVINLDLDGDIVGSFPTVTGQGVFMVGADGGIFAIGDAGFVGSVRDFLPPGTGLAQPAVGIVADPDGTGYWVVAADGGVFGIEAAFVGSLPGVLPPGTLPDEPVNGLVQSEGGYFMVADDGGVFAFQTGFAGSAKGLVDTKVVGLASVG